MNFRTHLQILRIFRGLNILFALQFTAALWWSIKHRHYLPASIKPGLQLPKSCVYLWIPFTVHVLYYVFELITSGVVQKHPYMAVHHDIAIVLAVVSMVERQWYTSSLFVLPWWAHAVAFGSKLAAPYIRLPTADWLLILYNIVLTACCGGGLYFGYKEQWKRFTPIIPCLGWLMFLANYQQYCTEMFGKLCLTYRYGEMAHTAHSILVWGVCIFVLSVGFGSLLMNRLRKRRAVIGDRRGIVRIHGALVDGKSTGLNKVVDAV